MSDEKITWPSTKQALLESLEWDLEHGNLDLTADLDDLAWERAAGDGDSSIYYRANALWLDSSEVRDFEDEAEELGWGEAETIQERICFVVFLALRAAYLEGMSALQEQNQCCICQEPATYKVRVGGTDEAPETEAYCADHADENEVVPV